jgi:adenylate cyclase
VPGPASDELVSTLIRLGASRASAEAAVASGDPEGAVFEPVLLPGRRERTVTPIEVAARGGLSVEETGELMQAFGLPRPADDETTFTEVEAGVLIELERLSEVWPRTLRVQLARVYGRMLARIARAELQAFRVHAAPRAQARSADAAAQLQARQVAFAELLSLTDPLLTGVHRRWLEHELGQLAISDAETRGGAGELPGAVEVAFMFCDVKDFTAYAETHGDEAAIATIEQFFDAVERERGERGRVVKSLGDGAMLVFDDPREAVAAGARLIAALSSAPHPGVHVSVHHGVAIARDGDYFGSAVNLAARLLAFGGRGELIATEPVVTPCDEFGWESLGAVAIRGVSGPVPIYRLS